MPSISESLSNVVDMSRTVPVAPPHLPSVQTPSSPGRSKYIRCPVPPMGVVSPDQLQQWDKNGQVPQYRLFQGSN